MDTLQPVIIASRSSPLAKAQVEEFRQEVARHHPDIRFEVRFVETMGDIDQKTSLRTLDKTDFFTKEIDLLLLMGECRVGVHSAKDLPAPLPKGLVLAALTQGVDPSDSLVLREGATLDTLPRSPVIATSSMRREDAVRELILEARFIDLRGPIHKRLEVLEQGQADGVVLAEAALIRLRLTHLNRVKVPGETVPFQGQLAIVVRDSDKEMIDLFAPLDTSTKG